MSKFLDDYLTRFPDLPKPKLEIRTDGKEIKNVRGELACLDQAIINHVRKKYPSMFVPDLNEFVLEFCNEHPYRGSIVQSRAEKLRSRGWK